MGHQSPPARLAGTTAVVGRDNDGGIVDQIGGTPLLRIRLFERVAPGVEVWGKAEFMNPGGSVKDRPALRMIEEGERTGRLGASAPSGAATVILDSTSGNTGIAYAMIGAAKGYPVRLVMPTNVSSERRQLIEAYGAEIVFSDAMEGSDGAIRLAHQMYRENPSAYYMPDQYNNPANWQAHFDSTGPEIWQQTAGRITHFIAGLGTTGTFTGVTRRLRQFTPAVRCLAVQPDEPWHGLEGLKHMDTAIRPGFYDPDLADENWGVNTEDAYTVARRLAREQGILAGHSSGAALHVAGEVAPRLGTGVIVVVLSDGGARYLSSGLYRRAG